jgi:hypothetical protein
MEQNQAIVLFQEKQIRRVWHNDEWYFVIVDVVQVLADTKNPTDYLKKLRKRDFELNKAWVQIAVSLLVDTNGGKQRINCANTEGVLMIIMSVPSSKAHSLKLWIAQASKEKLDNFNKPMIISILIETHAKLNEEVLRPCLPKTYLMRETQRGYYKIGKAMNPKIRESTLQAELPTIELLHIIERDIEAYLHKKFAAKRLRGEWFNLSKSDVNYIKSY